MFEVFNMSLLVLSAADVAKVTAKFTPDELVALMADVFSRLSERHRGIHQPHRTAIPMEHHTTLFMPSRISSAGTTIKVVSVPSADAPKDVKEKGLPGTTIVLDERSGGVRAVVNSRRLTALRNAAGTHMFHGDRSLAGQSSTPSPHAEARRTGTLIERAIRRLHILTDGHYNPVSRFSFVCPSRSS